MGIVSAKGRNQLRLLENVAGYENFIQTDAAINMGNSGGALVDAKGRLVGVNSAIISPSRGNIGIGFAIPVNFAAYVMNSLIATGTVSRGYLGVSSETVTADVAEQLGLPKDAKGVAITDITPDSPADKGGLKRTDVILAINDKSVSSLEELRLTVAQMLPDTKVKIKLIREAKELTLEVTLGKLTEKPDELLAGVPRYRYLLAADDELDDGCEPQPVWETDADRARLDHTCEEAYEEHTLGRRPGYAASEGGLW
jgi:serine protease Do/serine protease DegQ